MFLILLAVSIGAAAQEAAAPAPKLVKYYMGFLKKGPKWTAQPPADGKQIQAGHMAHLKKMADAGYLVVAGPFGGDAEIRGILVFRGTTAMEEMKMLAEKDPAVEAGRLAVEIHPWYVEEGVLPK